MGFPLQSVTPFDEPCLSRSLLLSCPSVHRIRPCIRSDLGSRVLLPPKSRTRGSTITPQPEPLLSWGSPALRSFPLPALASHETPLFRTFTRLRRGQRGALEFFCRKSGTAPKSVLTPLLFSASSVFPTCSTRVLLRVYLFRRTRVPALLRMSITHP